MILKGVAVLALLLLQGTAARPGAVTGLLQTREGAPALAIRVSALPAPPPNIRPSDGQNYYSVTVPASTTVTDAKGRFRLANLAPGRYFIVASPFGYSTFYPGTTNADGATIVTVTDSVVDGVDFTVVMPPGGRVTGRVDIAPDPGAQERAILSGLALGELLETPVGADGSFAFGHLPKGSYLLSLFPTPPGMASRAFTVGESDTRVDLVRPVLRAVSGRVVAERGPLPTALLAFTTDVSYEPTPVNADGTFSTRLQSARHRVDLSGMPTGYSLGSVRLGTQDVTRGLEVGAADVPGLVITIATPDRFARLRGKVVDVASARLANARVELTGRTIRPLEAPVKPDGSFEFPALVPGTYRLRLPEVPEVAPAFVLMGQEDMEVQVGR
jgi:hypothetical protein